MKIIQETIKEYSLEIFILLLGLVASIVELILIADKNLGVVIILISLFITISTVSIRREMQKRVEPIFSLVAQIPEEWRGEAQLCIENLYKTLRTWVDGIREVPKAEIITYEVKMIHKTTKSVEGLYNCIPIEALFLWSFRRTMSFRKYAESFKKLPKEIRKRRIFVLKKNNFLGDNHTINNNVKEIFKEQIAPVTDGGMGMQARILWIETAQKNNIDIPGSFLIVDEKEVFLVKGSEMLPYLNAEAIVNSVILKNFVELYEKLWILSDPIEKWFNLKSKGDQDG